MTRPKRTFILNKVSGRRKENVCLTSCVYNHNGASEVNSQNRSEVCYGS